MTTSQHFYDRSPYWLQHLMLNAYAVRIHRERYGKSFQEAYRRLEETQWYDEGQILEYQAIQLRKLVDHAYRNVPFYRQLYDEHGVSSSDIREVEDLRKLPVITREQVRSAGERMISSKIKHRTLVHGHTSGTTGSPLSFYWDKQTCVYNNAVDWRQKSWAGVNCGERMALLLGRTIVPANKSNPPFWQEDRLHKMLWVSSFHLSTRYLPVILKKLRSYAPSAIEGYPSTVYILAKYLKAIGETLPMRAVFTSAETLLPLQRELIEERFAAPVFDIFGMAERVAYAGQCEKAQHYHLSFEYAVNEIVDQKGQPVEGGEEGYLVGTSLLNFGMPFIRYRTSDVSAITKKKCICGRYMPRLKGVTTKDEDIVVTPEGKLISSSILTHPFKPLDSVLESQIVQDEPDRIRVKIVRRSDYTDEDSVHLVDALRERVGPGIRIDLEFVEEIPRTASGKFRWVVSRVPLPI